MPSFGTSIDASSVFQNVTPSDTLTLTDTNGNAQRTKGIAFGTAGALAITDAYNNTVIIPSGVLSAGIIHPIQTQQILSTGTGALNIVAFF